MKLFAALALLVIALPLTVAQSPPRAERRDSPLDVRQGAYFESVQHLRR